MHLAYLVAPKNKYGFLINVHIQKRVLARHEIRCDVFGIVAKLSIKFCLKKGIWYVCDDPGNESVRVRARVGEERDVFRAVLNSLNCLY